MSHRGCLRTREHRPKRTGVKLPWEHALDQLEKRIMTALDDAVAALTVAVNDAIAAGIGTSGADDAANVTAAIGRLEDRIAALETENASLRQSLQASTA